VVVAGLLAGGLLAGCAGGDDAGVSDAEGRAAAGAAADEQAAEDASGGEAAADDTSDDAASDDAAAGGADGTGVVVGVPAAGRRVVTVGMTLSVPDVSRAAADARDLAVRSGGYVASESSSGGDAPEATLRLRIPVDRADATVGDLAALGEELGRTVESEDVEDQLVDLESRTASARESIARVRVLLERAADLEDVVLLERELADRQADYESLEARRAALADLAEFATVTVSLVPPDAPVAAGGGPPGFLGGLDAGWRALAVTTSTALTVLGAIVPFAGVAAVGAALVWVVVLALRARARRRTTA
jgi:hypothetical protein